MAVRRTHSTIDKIPTELKACIDRMIVDNEWPKDFKSHSDGNPTYDDIVEYCGWKGFKLSRSAVGRYGMNLRALAKMKQSGLIARNIMADLTDEKASETQKAAVEMITAHAIELMAQSENMNSKELTNVARAMRDCAAVAIRADEYIRSQIKAKTETAVKSIDRQLKKQIDPETLKIIKEQIYGIIEK